MSSLHKNKILLISALLGTANFAFGMEQTVTQSARQSAKEMIKNNKLETKELRNLSFQAFDDQTDTLLQEELNKRMSKNAFAFIKKSNPTIKEEAEFKTKEAPAILKLIKELSDKFETVYNEKNDRLMQAFNNNKGYNNPYSAKNRRQVIEKADLLNEEGEMSVESSLDSEKNSKNKKNSKASGQLKIKQNFVANAQANEQLEIINNKENIKLQEQLSQKAKEQEEMKKQLYEAKKMLNEKHINDYVEKNHLGLDEKNIQDKVNDFKTEYKNIINSDEYNFENEKKLAEAQVKLKGADVLLKGVEKENSRRIMNLGLESEDHLRSPSYQRALNAEDQKLFGGAVQILDAKQVRPVVTEEYENLKTGLQLQHNEIIDNGNNINKLNKEIKDLMYIKNTLINDVAISQGDISKTNKDLKDKEEKIKKFNELVVSQNNDIKATKLLAEKSEEKSKKLETETKDQKNEIERLKIILSENEVLIAKLKKIEIAFNTVTETLDDNSTEDKNKLFMIKGIISEIKK